MMSKNKCLLLAIGLSTGISLVGKAQTVIGMGTESPNPNAVLELVPKNNNQGFLAPRLTSAQRTAPSFTGRLTDTDNGLLIFDTSQGQFFYWYQGEWRRGVSGEAGGNPPGQGTTWYTGTTTPAGINAQEGDFYINESTGDIYRLSNGTFRLMGSIAASEGGSVNNQNLAAVLQQGNSAANQRITNVGTPADANDAATKAYTDGKNRISAFTITDENQLIITEDGVNWQVNLTPIQNGGGNENNGAGTWYTGVNEPASANVGNARNGDYYYSTRQNKVYRKVGGNWQGVGGFTAVDDASVDFEGQTYTYRTPRMYTGPGKPDDDAKGLGQVGDFFFSPDEEKTYTKIIKKNGEVVWKNIN